MRALLFAALLAGGTAQAHAAVITFEGAPFGSFTGGPVTEDGFTYSLLSGDAFISDNGNPGQDLEAFVNIVGATGIVRITSADNPGSTFTFNALDYSAYSFYGTGSQTLTVVGRRQGQIVGTDSYTLANSSVLVPSGGGLTYTNWTKEYATNLFGVTLDSLDVTVFGKIYEDPLKVSDDTSQNVDNIVLTPTVIPVPEPASLALLGLSVAGSAALRRRRVE